MLIINNCVLSYNYISKRILDIENFISQYIEKNIAILLYIYHDIFQYFYDTKLCAILSKEIPNVDDFLPKTYLNPNMELC